MYLNGAKTGMVTIAVKIRLTQRVQLRAIIEYCVAEALFTQVGTVVFLIEVATILPSRLVIGDYVSPYSQL